MSFRIRRADRKDIKGIQAVAFRSWRDTYQDLFPSEVIEKFLDSAYSLELLKNVIAKDRLREKPLFFVGEEDGGVIAYAELSSLEEGVCELLRIYVDPSCQKKGVGSALLDRLLRQVPMKKLFAWVEKENRKGCRFYEKHGFYVAEEMEEDFLGFRTKTLRYELNLG